MFSISSLSALSFFGLFRTYVLTDPLDSKRTGASSGASTRGLDGEDGAAEVDMRWRLIAAVRRAALCGGRAILLRRTLRAYIWPVVGSSAEQAV